MTESISFLAKYRSKSSASKTTNFDEKSSVLIVNFMINFESINRKKSTDINSQGYASLHVYCFKKRENR